MAHPVPTPPPNPYAPSAAVLEQLARQRIATIQATQNQLGRSRDATPPRPPDVPLPVNPNLAGGIPAADAQAARIRQQYDEDKRTGGFLGRFYGPETAESLANAAARRQAIRDQLPDLGILGVANSAIDQAKKLADAKTPSLPIDAAKAATLFQATRSGLVSKVPFTTGLLLGPIVNPILSPEGLGGNEESAIAQQQAAEAALDRAIDAEVRRIVVAENLGVLPLPTDGTTPDAPQQVKMTPVWTADP